MATLHHQFASLGFDDAAAADHDHDSKAREALQSESHGAPPLAAAAKPSAAADDDGVEGLFARLARDLHRATTEQQRLDAIAPCLFVGNAMRDWRESHGRTPQEAFGFLLVRAMPSAAECLQMCGEPGGARAWLGETGGDKRVREWVGGSGERVRRALVSTRSRHPCPTPLPNAHSHPPPCSLHGTHLTSTRLSHAMPAPANLLPMLTPPWQPRDALPAHPLLPYAHPHAMPPTAPMAGMFCLRERSSGRANSSADWKSIQEQSHAARTVAVTVAPHLLPGLSASAAASLHHACRATHLGVLSSQTNLQGDKPLTLVYIADSTLPPPHRSPAASASARSASCSAVAALLPTVASVGPDTIPAPPGSSSQPPWLVFTAPLARLHSPPGSSSQPPWLVFTAPLARLHSPPGSSSQPPWLVFTAPLARLHSPPGSSSQPPWLVFTAPLARLHSPPGSSSQLSASPQFTAPLSPAPHILTVRHPAHYYLSTPPSLARPCAASRSSASKLVDITLLRDIISFVSERALRHPARKASGTPQGVSFASARGLADAEAATDGPGLTDEDAEELNIVLKRRGVDVVARHLDAIG
ncbi:unnamed protein product [Closterium sp. NIES-64]|nr:unnamed protein product [Closterium sp. NIES-64]